MNPNQQGDQARKSRDDAVVGVLVRVMLLNLLVAVLKLTFGFLAGAVSMLADGLHSALDSASNIVGLVGIGVARRAPDEDHPYGHRKFEALAALGIAMFLFLTSAEVLREVVRRLNGEHEVTPHPETFLVMVLTLVINLGVTRYERREGKRHRSAILLADARHTQSDVYVSLGVIGSLIAALLDFPILDVVVALAITVFIAYSGYQIVVGAFVILSDSTVVDPEQAASAAMAVPGITHAHRVRSRGVPDDIHVDLHIHVPPDMTTAKAHDLAHEVSEKIRVEFKGVTDVVVHVEPEGHGGD